MRDTAENRPIKGKNLFRLLRLGDSAARIRRPASFSLSAPTRTNPASGATATPLFQAIGQSFACISVRNPRDQLKNKLFGIIHPSRSPQPVHQHMALSFAKAAKLRAEQRGGRRILHGVKKTAVFAGADQGCRGQG